MEINIEAAENVITEENAQETLTQAQQIGALESVLFVTGEPIPKAEMDANPSLQGQQNPGY